MLEKFKQYQIENPILILGGEVVFTAKEEDDLE